MSKIVKSAVVLKDYSGNVVDIYGQSIINVCFKDFKGMLPLIVDKGKHHSLFGCNWFKT